MKLMAADDNADALESSAVPAELDPADQIDSVPRTSPSCWVTRCGPAKGRTQAQQHHRQQQQLQNSTAVPGPVAQQPKPIMH